MINCVLSAQTRGYASPSAAFIFFFLEDGPVDSDLLVAEALVRPGLVA